MFKPVNRYILIEVRGDTELEEPLIVLPEDYKPEKSRYVEAHALEIADDTRLDLEKGVKLIIDRSMIEEIVIGRTIYNVILDNYVVGIIE
jgi:hypothetical protein